MLKHQTMFKDIILTVNQKSCIITKKCRWTLRTTCRQFKIQKACALRKYNNQTWEIRKNHRVFLGRFATLIQIFRQWVWTTNSCFLAGNFTLKFLSNYWFLFVGKLGAICCFQWENHQTIKWTTKQRRKKDLAI
jgi:hypothetical protein